MDLIYLAGVLLLVIAGGLLIISSPALRNRHSLRFACSLLLLLGIYLVLSFNLRLVVTGGRSMEPTYREGTLLLCMKTHRTPRPDEVICFQYGEKLLVKRVAAVSGERVRVLNAEGEEQFYDYWEAARQGEIPPGFLFVCGDNYADSYDSRSEDFGLVPVSSVWGFPLVILSRSFATGD